MMSCRSFTYSDYQRGMLWGLSAERHEKIQELKQLNVELLKLKEKCKARSYLQDREVKVGERNDYRLSYVFINYIKVKEQIKLLNRDIEKLNDKMDIVRGSHEI